MRFGPGTTVITGLAYVAIAAISCAVLTVLSAQGSGFTPWVGTLAAMFGAALGILTFLVSLGARFIVRQTHVAVRLLVPTVAAGAVAGGFTAVALSLLRTVGAVQITMTVAGVCAIAILGLLLASETTSRRRPDSRSPSAARSEQPSSHESSRS